MPTKRLRNIIVPLLFGAALTACTDLNLTNPNQRSTSTFWKTSADAQQGLAATYNALMNNGTFGRWQAFAFDIRSDEGYSPSPWGDLNNFNKFTFASYDFEVNREIWQQSYTGIFRANQVIANVPNIDMDATQRDQIVGQAKFIRALLYFQLENLYDNIPLVTTPPQPTDRPATATPDAIWAQIEQDLTDAAAVLPPSWSGDDVGRATSGAATSLLGKAYLQQRKWQQAADALGDVITNGGYDLVPNYADNFTALNENNQESIFEVQFGDRSLLASGVRGLNIARMVGPCGPSFCDGRPTRWFFDQFFLETTLTGQVDPRLDATLFWNKPGGEDVYTIPYTERYGAATQDLYFKKWGEYYLGIPDQDWDAGINYRVIRFADVLLAHAEALNEVGQTPLAYADINRVRARVNLAPLAPGLSADAMRDRILHERLLELGLEGQRWLDLRRHDLLDDVLPVDVGDPACPPPGPFVAGCDAEFQFFVPGKSDRLPIPQTERDLNPNVAQNPGW